MSLVAETVKILENTLVDGVSLLDLAYLSHNPKYGTWSGDSLTNIEKALDKAAKSLPKSLLIKEYNELAAQNDCDQITDWDYDTQAMDLEIFIDEVYQQIEELKNA
jgi:hypothetical protein